jgi:hypothetical protein
VAYPVEVVPKPIVSTPVVSAPVYATPSGYSPPADNFLPILQDSPNFLNNLLFSGGITLSQLLSYQTVDTIDIPVEIHPVEAFAGIKKRKKPNYA